MSISLAAKVKKTIQNKKKEGDGDDNAILAADSNVWKFAASSSKHEEYIANKNIFDVKTLECPVLWIRVDPDFKYIRKVVFPQFEENLHYQLLKEKDIIGQYEAIKSLAKIPNELSYNALKSVSQSD
jgi:hypothetical protein